jgi:hypothetical protein
MDHHLSHEEMKIIQRGSMDLLHPYLNPARLGSLGSVVKYLAANEDGKLSDLQKLEAYTIHKRKLKKFKRNPVIVTDVGYQFQADLMDVQKISYINRRKKYCLVVIDCFSRKASCVPISNKSGDMVVQGFEQVFKELGVPEKLQVDRGECPLISQHCANIRQILATIIQDWVNCFQPSNLSYQPPVLQERNSTIPKSET